MAGILQFQVAFEDRVTTTGLRPGHDAAMKSAPG